MNRWTAREFQVAANLIDDGVVDFYSQPFRSRWIEPFRQSLAHDRRLKREMLPMSPWVKRGVHIQR